MPPKPLVDLNELDLNRVLFDPRALDGDLPQSGHMRQLHGVVAYEPERGFAVGFRDIKDDEFWVAGHFPNRPVFPGVLLVETVAQLCVFYWRQFVGRKEAPDRALLFGGIDQVKFRDAIYPGQRVYVAIQAEDIRLRRSSFKSQAFVDGKMMFEGVITGLLGPAMPEIYGQQG